MFNPEIKVAIVEWMDSSTVDGWRHWDEDSRVELGGSLTCRSVGLLLDEDDDAVYLTTSIASAPGHVNAVTAIPRRCITYSEVHELPFPQELTRADFEAS